jgi:glycosyltransferase involved in cell wall biosynthesis
VPVFNRAAELIAAVNSVRAQTYPHWELLIVDDGSTDDTVVTAERLVASDPERIRLLRQVNAGPGAARETGRQAARGEYLQYLDSDDRLLPAKLELQVAAFQADPLADIAYCRCRELGPDGEELVPALRPSDIRLEAMFPTFLAERWWNTLVPLYRATLCHRAGAWLALYQEEDWEYDARIAALAPRLAFVDATLAVVHHHAAARLSGAGNAVSGRLRDRAEAHALIFQHARRGGVRGYTPESGRFARELFLLARQCGAAGLTAESRRLFALARSASPGLRAFGLDFALYRGLAAIVGWSRAGKLAHRFDALRTVRDSS